MQNLTKKTYFAYALQAYNNPSCSGLHEFKEDLFRLKYVKRLLHRYIKNGDISIRLLLNHIIGIFNIFHAPAIARLLFFRTEPSAWSALKTVLEYVNLMPEQVDAIDGVVILNSHIPRDEVLWGKLQESVDRYAANR